MKRKGGFLGAALMAVLLMSSSLLAVCPNADFNDDGKVNLVDFSIMALEWRVTYNLDDLEDFACHWLEKCTGVNQNAIVLVAASDSLDQVKAGADYVCDGTADEVQIQAAITKVGNSGTVRLSEGTFTLSDKVVLYDGVRITGCGYNTRVVQVSTSSGFNLFEGTDMNNVVIENFRIDGNRTNVGDKAEGVSSNIQLYGCVDCTVKNMWLENACAHGIHVFGTNSSRTSITPTRFLVQNCRFKDCRARAIHFAGGVGHSIFQNLICINSSLFAGGYDPAKESSTIIEGCLFIGSSYGSIAGGGGSATRYPPLNILARSTQPSSTKVYNSARMVIANNVIVLPEDDIYAGPGVLFAGEYMQDVLFTNNVVDVQSSSSGLRFLVDNTMRRITITNNNITAGKDCIAFIDSDVLSADIMIKGNCLTSRNSRGVGAYNAGIFTNSIISENIMVTPLQYGVDLGTVGGAVKNMQVQNNIIYYWSSTSGLGIANATYASVAGNIMIPVVQITTGHDHYSANDNTDWQAGDICTDNEGSGNWAGTIALVDADNQHIYIDLNVGTSSSMTNGTEIYNVTRGETDVFTKSDPTGTFSVASGIGNRVSNNIGYNTSNTGTATVTSGNTYVDVIHGLDITPDAANIIVTPTNNLGSATKFWVDTIGSTTFRIHVDVDPRGDATFAWKIVDE